MKAGLVSSAERRNRYLSALYDYQEKTPGLAPNVVDLFGEEPDEQEDMLWRDTVRGLDLEGYVTAYETGVTATITDSGRALVEERRAMVANPAFQRRVAVNGILHRLYHQDPDGTGWLQLESLFGIQIDGVPIREQVLRRATVYLVGQGLAKGGTTAPDVAGYLTLQITDAGQRCVESGKDVDEFMSDSAPKAGNVFNIQTINGGSLAVDATNFSQTSTTYTGSPADDLKILLAALAESLPVFALTEEQTEAVSRDIEVLEGEAERANPNQRFIRDRLMETLDTVVGAGNQALGLVLMGMAKKWAVDVGLPIGEA